MPPCLAWTETVTASACASAAQAAAVLPCHAWMLAAVAAWLETGHATGVLSWAAMAASKLAAVLPFHAWTKAAAAAWLETGHATGVSSWTVIEAAPQVGFHVAALVRRPASPLETWRQVGPARGGWLLRAVQNTVFG